MRKIEFVIFQSIGCLGVNWVAGSIYREYFYNTRWPKEEKEKLKERPPSQDRAPDQPRLDSLSQSEESPDFSRREDTPTELEAEPLSTLPLFSNTSLPRFSRLPLWLPDKRRRAELSQDSFS